MARPPRIQYEGALYHLFPRGNRRDTIVENEQDYRMIEKYMIEAAQASAVLPRSWYPMPNHFHLMVETPLANLSEFMHRWLSRYARYYNRVHGKIGHLFQGRFGSRLVQSDAYQKELIRYIDLNAHCAKNYELIRKWGDLYCSRRFFMGETCSEEVRRWIDPMLQLFGENPQAARENYARFLADGLKTGDWENFYKPRDGVVGDDRFLESLRARQRASEIEKKPSAGYAGLRLNELLNATLRTFPISREELCSASQGRSLGNIRKAVAYVGRNKMKLGATSLARLLGRDHSAISQMLQRVERERPAEVDKLLAATLTD